MLGRIGGAVRDAVSLTPIPGAFVYISDTVTEKQVTDTNGNYLSEPLPMGSYNVVACKEGFASTSLTTNAQENVTAIFDFYLIPLICNSRLYGQKPGGIWQALAADEEGNLSVVVAADNVALDGKYFVINTGVQSLLAHNLLLVQLSNPEASGKVIQIDKLVVGGSADTSTSHTNMIIDVLGNASFSAAGTSLPVYNANLGSLNTSLMTAKWLAQAIDPIIGGNLLWTYLMVEGFCEIPVSGKIVLQGSDTLVVRLYNSTAKKNSFSIAISWQEKG